MTISFHSLVALATMFGRNSRRLSRRTIGARYRTIGNGGLKQATMHVLKWESGHNSESQHP
jgi:hypothetical protein